jgi:hypothetical protein
MIPVIGQGQTWTPIKAAFAGSTVAPAAIR